MTIRVTIKHDDTAAARILTVTVVTVGNVGAQDRQVLLAAGEQTTVEVGPGQFVMVDEKEA